MILYTNYLKTITNDKKFIAQLNSIKTNLLAKGKYLLPGEKHALKRIDDILEHIRSGSDFQLNVIGYTNFRPIDDFIGGGEFLESSLGKRFIDVCFYFSYVYWPQHGPK